MNVVVQFHRQVRDDLEQWFAGREPDDQNRRALVQVYVDELIRTLTETEGEPPGAVLWNRSAPRIYRWRYTGEIELTYEVRVEGRGYFRAALLRIIVTEIQLEPAE